MVHSNWTETIVISNKRGKIIRYDCTKGIDIGEYKYKVFDTNGNYVTVIYPREIGLLNLNIEALSV
jgi:hypothetical protein